MKTLHTPILILIPMMILTLPGCSEGNRRLATVASLSAPFLADESTLGEVAGQRGRGEAEFAASPSRAEEPLTLAVQPFDGMDQYLIKTARVTVESGDAAASLRFLSQAAADCGGYVANLNESVDNLGRRNITVEIRVPSAQLEDTLLQLAGLGKVLQKTVTTQDVSEEYLDADARMRNLKRTEARVLEHLDRMGTLEDILKVENELTRVRQQIEQLEGRLRYLDQRVTFSTIHCTFFDAPKTGPVTPPATFSTGEELSTAVRALVGFAQVVWVVLIWIGVWSPVWLLCGLLPAILVRRRLRAQHMAG